jgi:hypothetical protein
VRQSATRLAREVDHLRHVGEIVEREADRLRPPRVERVLEVLPLEDLQVEEPHLVPGLQQRRGDALHAARLQAQVDLGEQQRTRVDEQDAHRWPPGQRIVWRGPAS